MKNRAYVAMAMAAAFASPLTAATLFDQGSFAVPTETMIVVGSSVINSGNGFERWQAQSVRAGLSGTLARVDLQVTRTMGNADLLLTIGAGEVTDGGWAPFATIVIPNATVPNSAETNSGGYLSVDVSGLGFGQTAGQTFTLMLSVGASAVNSMHTWALGLSGDGGNTLHSTIVYAEGVNRQSQDQGASWSETSLDRGFRTWVTTAGVPEPATWAMLIAGFGLVGAAARRRLGKPVRARTTF